MALKTDLVKITVKREDRGALRLLAAIWGISLQDAFARLVSDVHNSDTIQTFKAKMDAAISAEGGEDAGQ